MSESSEPRVHSSAGGVNCMSYHAGHNTHWIPVLRRYPSSPRQPVSIRHIGGNEFEVAFDRQTHVWQFHDGPALARLIAKNPDNFVLVTGTTFINYNWNAETGGVGWFYMAKDEMRECLPPMPDEVYED